jgi:hypothetical protein
VANPGGTAREKSPERAKPWADPHFPHQDIADFEAINTEPFYRGIGNAFLPLVKPVLAG